MTTDAHELNPWFSMWTKPRVTIQQIVDSHPERYVFLLAAAGGFSQALDKASIRNLGDEHSLGYVFLGAAIGGPIAGVLSLYIFGALLKWTGAWLGGTASSINLRAAIAWSFVPLIWALFLWIPELLVFGKDLFTSETPTIDKIPLVMIGFGLLEVVIGIWATVVLLKSLGQVQGFSAWRALGNVVLSALVVLLPILVLALALSKR